MDAYAKNCATRSRRSRSLLTAWTEACLPLAAEAGEHEIILRLTGRLAIDWFRLGGG